MIYNLPNNSFLKVQDIFDDIPNFMYNADIIFTDPPYNQSLYSNFLNREGIIKSNKNTGIFNDFIDRLFECINMIKPNILFLEIGKEFLSIFIEKCKFIYKYVNFYNSFFYNKKDNKCYIIHATNNFKKKQYKIFEDMDEEKIIKWICENINYNCIGDFCMGKGLVGKYAYLNNKSFVGTELNKKRLTILIDFILEKEKKKNG